MKKKIPQHLQFGETSGSAGMGQLKMQFSIALKVDQIFWLTFFLSIHLYKSLEAFL